MFPGHALRALISANAPLQAPIAGLCLSNLPLYHDETREDANMTDVSAPPADIDLQVSERRLDLSDATQICIDPQHGVSGGPKSSHNGCRAWH